MLIRSPVSPTTRFIYKPIWTCSGPIEGKCDLHFICKRTVCPLFWIYSVDLCNWLLSCVDYHCIMMFYKVDNVITNLNSKKKEKHRLLCKCNETGTFIELINIKRNLLPLYLYSDLMHLSLTGSFYLHTTILQQGTPLAAINHNGALCHLAAV